MTPHDLVCYYLLLIWRADAVNDKVDRTVCYDEPAMVICNLQEICRKRGLL